MSLQLEFLADQKKIILQLPLDDSSDVLEESCQNELNVFFDLIKPLPSKGSLIPSQMIPKISLVNSIKNIINIIDKDKSLRVKQYRISCEFLKFHDCRCLNGIVLKGQEGYYCITKEKNRCILEKQVLSEDGTKVLYVDPIDLNTGIIETNNMGVICISAKKTKPTLYFRLKKLMIFLNSIKTDTILVVGDEIGEFNQDDFDEQ
jgi:hypothetical protein